MKKLWVGILLLSLVWLFALPLYEPANRGWWLFLFFGLAANSLAFWRSELQPIPRGYVALLIPLALFAVVTGWPHNLGAFLLMLALLAALVVRQNRRVHSVAFGVGFSGLVLLIQALVLPVYEHLAARLHSLSALVPVLAFLVNLLGGKASFNQGSLFIQTAKGVSELYTTWEAFGFFILLNVALGGVVLFLFSDRSLDNLLKLLAILIAYAVVRYLLLLFAFASFESSDIFWLRPWLVVSFIPLPFVLMKLLPLTSQPRPLAVPAISFNWRTVSAGGLASLAVLALTGSLLFQDPGVRKPGRVLFDEGHSDWEWMGRPYDTEWYGEQSGYNYYSMGQFLNHYYQVDIKKESLTPELLSQYDVLVLKTPTSAYGPAEVKAVVDFVKAGGGLWLIGDHTNVFGMSTYLNEIASEFGFAFKYDATYDLATGNLSFYKPEKGQRHPVLNQVPFYMFATSCSLDAPLSSEDVIIGYGLKSVRADYSQKSFFPKDAESATALEYGLLLQSAAYKYGQGRVLLYTDSTCFSNFYMFMTGKPELTLGSIEWLNRKNRYGFVSMLLLVLSLLALGTAIALIRKNVDDGISSTGRHGVVLLALFALVVGVSSGILAVNRVNQGSYPPPRPHTAYPMVAFEADHSRYYLPIAEHKTTESDLQTFYVWTQRLGIVPEVKYNFIESLKESDAVVVINPARAFTEKEVAEFVKYIESGGKALVMDDPRNITQSTAYQLLRPFNMRIDFRGIADGNIEDEQGTLIWQGQHFGEVQGGQPYLFLKPITQQNPTESSPKDSAKNDLLKGEDSQAKPRSTDPTKSNDNPDKVLPRVNNRRPVLSIGRRGDGMLAVLSNSTMFTTETMGPTATIPDENRRKIYDLEYQIFRDLLKVPVEVQPKLVSRRTQ